MSANVQPSTYYEKAILIEEPYGEEVAILRTDVCDLVEKVLPFAEADCDELVDRITAALIPHITEQLRVDGWVPRRNYPCGCSPTFLCRNHMAVQWSEFLHKRDS